MGCNLRHDFEKELIRILHKAIRPTLDSLRQKTQFYLVELVD